MEGPDPHMYLPPMILPGDAGPVIALRYSVMLVSSQVSLLSVLPKMQDVLHSILHRGMIWMTAH